jgi:hypothetical protein
MRVIHDEDPGTAAHGDEAGIGHECRAAFMEAQPAEDPGRAALGEPPLHVGSLQVPAGEIVRITGLRLDGDQKQRPGLTGGVAGGGVVVDPLHRGGRGRSEWHRRGGLETDERRADGRKRGPVSDADAAGRGHAGVSSK